jgi:PAS domain S-box-containing protein
MKENVRPPRSYKWFFLGIFLLAELCLVGLDLYYLYGQNGTVSDFIFDWAITSGIIVALVIITYLAVRRILLRYMHSEKRFRELADLLPEGVYEADAEGRLTFANKRAMEWFGYTPEEVTSGQLDLLQMIAEKDRQAGVESLSGGLTGALTGSRTYTARKKDGSGFPVIISSSRVMKEGRPVGVRGVLTDFTEQKRVEDIIRESERKYRELADSLPQVVFEMDTLGNFTYVNANAFKVFGYGEDALEKGMNVRDLMADGEAALADIALMVSSGTREVTREYEAKMHDGRVFPVVISAKLIMEGDEPVGVRGIVTDITEIKSAEEKIRMSEEKYRSLFESSIDGIVVVSLTTGKITEANQAFLDMVGYTREGLAEKRYWEMTPNKWFEGEAAIFRDQVLERGYSDEYEKEIIRKDGTVFPVSIRRWLITDDDGTPVAMWSIDRDITEKKAHEQQIERIHAELRGFAHTVSHDLKSPIHQVTLAVYTLERLLEMEPTPEIQRYKTEVLTAIRNGLDRANNLIDDMLVLAEAGQVPAEVIAVDISEKVEEVLAERAADIEIRGITVRRDEDLGIVVASPTHVYQIFSNLVKNAINYNDNPEPAIEIHALPDDGTGARRFEVRDNGSGIPEDLIDRIFVPFAKGDSGDTGIGLSIVERIVEIYGGKVRAYNDPGACFEFSLHDYVR